MLIIFAGNIGRSGLGGKAWANMQYMAGLTALGHEVVYLEDCGEGSWVYNWDTEQVTIDLKYPADYVRRCLEPLDIKDRWIYRAGDESEGMAIDDFLTACSEADLLIVWADPITVWRREYDNPKRRIFIDVDPGFTQISLATGHAGLEKTVARCERQFTVGQHIGTSACSIPSNGHDWLRTVPPVSLQHWPFADDDTATDFTSVMSWRGFRDVVYDGVLYGQKDKEFPKFLDIPRLTTQPFLIAQITEGESNPMVDHGWKTVPGWISSGTVSDYQTFIQTSRAEFGVAKHGYVASQGGWFSDRSVCYLASGRPVLVEDTGLGDWLPTGEGIVLFKDVSEALDGIESINSDYERHRRAARRLAEEQFAADRVLASLLERAMA
jgi:hypothetical protein